MRTFMVSALWARVLLAMLVALDFVVDLVRAVTLEDYSLYQACLASPSTCHTLDPEFMGLTGTIPTEIGLFTALTTLYMFQNDLDGTLPTELGLLTALRGFDVPLNDFIGTLPTELGLLTALTMFRVYGTATYDNPGLDGTLPTELGQMTAVTDFKVFMNNLDGTLPTELGLMTAMKEFNVFMNNLHGTLPTELGQMTAVTDFVVRNNAGLSGPLVSVGSVGTDYNCYGPPGECDGIFGTNLVPSPPSPPSPPPSPVITTMSETPTCEETCGLVDVDVAQWTEDQAKCVSQCIKKQNSATTHAGAVGLVVGALAAAMYAFF